MAQIKKQPVALGQVAVSNTGATIASLLGLTTDEECLFPGVIVQADPANSDEIYLGGLDSAGVVDVAQNKSIKLIAGQGLALEADEDMADEDLQVYDLRQISLRSTLAQVANIMVIKFASIKYN